MIITEVKDRNEKLVTELVDVWERSVKATHLFLSASEIAQIKTYVPQALVGVEIKTYVPQALVGVAHLMVGEVSGKPVAFMGIEGNKIEMLFIAPEERGKGLGRQLVEYAFAKFNVTEVCVNEQNPQAHGFYERMGFEVYKRMPLDEQGQPYPLLYLRRAQD